VIAEARLRRSPTTIGRLTFESSGLLVARVVLGSLYKQQSWREYTNNGNHSCLKQTKARDHSRALSFNNKFEFYIGLEFVFLLFGI